MKLGKVIAMLVEKGGVGKTTISVQLAFELASRGFMCLVISNDMQGDAKRALLPLPHPPSITSARTEDGVANTFKLYERGSKFAPLKIRENLYLMGSDDSLTLYNGANDFDRVYNFKDSINLLKQQFDYIFIDCPASFGALTTAALYSANSGGVLIPINLDEQSKANAETTVARINRINANVKEEVPVLGLVLNKVKKPLSSIAKIHFDEIKEMFGDLVFKASLSETVKFQEAHSFQASVKDIFSRSSQPVMQIIAVTDELLSRLHVTQELQNV